MQFESEFLLDKKHFTECFNESEAFNPPKQPRHFFMSALVLLGIAIISVTEQQKTLGFFLIALAILEFFSFKYRRAWWVLRQNWSKNSGNTISLQINDQGIAISSLHQNIQHSWQDIKKVTETEKGVMLSLNNDSVSYLSKSCLNDEVILYMHSKL